MFKSRAMSKVELMIPERYVMPATEAMAASGVFHPARSTDAGGDVTQRKTAWAERAVRFAAIEQRIQSVMEELSIDAGAVPVKCPHPIEPEVAELDITRLEREADAPVRRLEAEEKRLAQLRRHLAQLGLIGGVEVDLGQLRSLQYTFAMLGSMPTANIERLRSSLEHIPSALIPLQEQGEHATVVLFGQQSNAEILNRAARSAYLDPFTPPEGYRGTPAEAIKALQAGIARTQRHIAESRLEVEQLQARRVSHVRHLYWRVRASRKLAETIAGYDRLHNVYLVQGWVPTDAVESFRTAVLSISPGIVIEALPAGQDGAGLVPAMMKNPTLVRPFEGLVSNYGYPTYGELDPTPVLALTFPLVFGLMFGDVGHGLLLLLLGLLLISRKVRSLAGLASMGTIVAACGGAAMIFGFLYGSIFGLEEVLPALWIQPLTEINSILIATVVIGALILSLGMVYNILNAALARQWGHMLFGHYAAADLIFYWSLLLIAARAFNIAIPLPGTVLAVMAIVAGLGMALRQLLMHLIEGERPLIEGSFGMYAAESFFELFETLIGLLSNTLSYVRMGAFAVAHGALSLVVFILADIISGGGGVVYYAVIILGNLFVVGFEGMIVAIQTLRLEYYEFFSKFFAGSGLRYQPLSLVGESA